jgi:hypothetical protein
MARQATLETCDPTGELGLSGELSAIKKAARFGISSSRIEGNDTSWNTWVAFCHSIHQDPWLLHIDDPMPLLQIYAERYRVGNIAPSSSPVKARTVEAALRAVGQTFSALGYQDPRLAANSNGKLDFRLHRQLQAYKKADPPPHRVKPVPLQVIQYAIHLCTRHPTPQSSTIAQMLVLGFFFLLRPGEYAWTDNPDAAPFRLCDVHLITNNVRLDPISCTEQQLTSATFVALEFTTQKNGVRGELVGLGRSGHPILCPVQAMIDRLKQLRLHNAIGTTPLYSFKDGNTWKHITTTLLTQHLRWATTALTNTVGVSPDDISIRSLRSSGAMALLCANVDSDKIRLLGRWRSDEMLRYLHIQAFPIVQPLAHLMVRHGEFTFIPNNRLG